MHASYSSSMVTRPCATLGLLAVYAAQTWSKWIPRIDSDHLPATAVSLRPALIKLSTDRKAHYGGQRDLSTCLSLFCMVLVMTSGCTPAAFLQGSAEIHWRCITQRDASRHRGLYEYTTGERKEGAYLSVWNLIRKISGVQ